MLIILFSFQLRIKIQRLEDENETAKVTISNLTKELDHLTLLHSQILVENTKLTNEKLRLEQEVRKSESRYETTVRNLQDKFNKEVTDLNQVNESHRSRLQELEAANKELRRIVVVCETSDSAPSSSGVSSVPTEIALKQTRDDIIQDYHSCNVNSKSFYYLFIMFFIFSFVSFEFLTIFKSFYCFVILTRFIKELILCTNGFEKI